MRTYILNATGTDISPATIIICVVIAAICMFAVISYRKKLKNGCCGGGDDEVKHVKPQDTNVNDYDHVYRMDIEDPDLLEIVRRYNIVSVPTLMFFRRGEVLWRESGRVDYEHLVNVLNELEKHEHVLL